MKLFLDTSAILKYPCGTAVYTKQLLRKIIKYEDCDIHTGLKALSPKTHICLKERLAEHVNGKIKYHSVYFPGRFPLTALQKIISVKCDIAHFMSNIIPPYLPYQDIKKSIITIHDMFIWHRDLSLYEDNLCSYFYRHQPEQAQKCAAIITVSEFSKKEIIKFLGVPAEKIHVIPIATQWTIPSQAQCNIFAGYGLEEKKYFLSVSSLNKHKNYTGLCHAFEKYHNSKNYGGEKLVIVGSRQYGDEMIFNKIQNTKDVIYIPRASEIELRYLYTNAKGFFLVSKLEGFGIPLLEAMSSHTPACYGKGNSMDELGRNAAVGVEPDDIDAITECFHYFSAAPADLKERIETAYQIAQEYTWENTAEKHYKLYQNVERKI